MTTSTAQDSTLDATQIKTDVGTDVLDTSNEEGKQLLEGLKRSGDRDTFGHQRARLPFAFAALWGPTDLRLDPPTTWLGQDQTPAVADWHPPYVVPGGAPALGATSSTSTAQGNPQGQIQTKAEIWADVGDTSNEHHFYQWQCLAQMRYRLRRDCEDGEVLI